MSSEEKTPEMTWPGDIAAITLFVEDLERAKRFYQDVFHLPVSFEDDNSAVFRFGETLVVEYVDATCERLRERGVEQLNGRWTRPWGIRTASFRDPGGHIWEIAH